MEELESIDAIDRLIHAPTRLKILTCLSLVESGDFNYLMHQTGLTRGNLSPNLRKLEEADYIKIKKEFVERVPRTLITLTNKGRTALTTYEDNMNEIFNSLKSGTM